MGLSPAIGYTAGLGKLTVLSSIGQPLVGEIELVSVRKEEISTLAARLAPPDAYKNANISFSPALVGARVSVQKRPSGQLYVRVTSTRPVDEPFIELLVELSWNTGRLVREYTALVDPPGFAPVPAATPVAAPETRPAPAVPVAPAAPRTAAPAPAPAPSGTAAATYGPVQSGDTLRRIAAGVKPQGVSLDQMLVGIFRSNPDAFINNNMNLLRAGRILRIPDANELAQLGPAEAEKEIRLQASDWNAYRQRASAVVPEIQTGAPLTAAGKITTKVDEPGSAAQTPAREVVKVSKGAPGKEGGAADKDMQERIRSLEEEATAREKTLKDSNDRIASLEKTIKDMQRLLELKGVAVPPPVKAPGDAPALAAAPNVGAEAVKPPVEGAEPGAKTAAEAPIPPALDAVPAEKPAVVAEPKPEPKPEQKPPEVPPPAPVIEQAWWEDPMLVGGGLLALGVLGGGAYALSRRRRDKQTSAVEAEPTFKAPLGMDETQQQTAMPAALTPVVASATSEMPTSGAVVAADDVDPIAEADVYIAYGRDAQAEEILREALAREPGREEIKLKLLEIYAARKSKNDFNPLAADLHSATGGKGDAWMRAAALGYALDSDNPLYAAGKDSTIESPVGVATDVNLDFDLDMVSAAGAPTTITDVPLDAGDDNIKTTILSPERMEALKAEGAAMAAKLTDSQSIVPDFDLGADMLAAPKTDVNLEPMAPAGPITDVNLALPAVAGTDSNVIDFEFDPGKTMKIEPEAAAAFAPDRTIAMSPQNQEKARDLGIEIDLGALDATSGSMPIDIAAEPPKAERTADLSFDFQLPGEPSAATPEIEVPPTDIRLDVPEFKPAETATMDFSLDTVSLDLGDDKKVVEQAPVRDDHWYDVQTKFDLAKAYQEMGDKDGAREILSEVIKEGDAQQQAEATELMAKLG